MLTNHTFLLGRLTQEPELKQGPNGVFLHNTIAVDGGFNKDTNEEITDFVSFALFGSSAEYVNKYLQKGSMIAIEGKLFTYKHFNDKTQENNYDLRLKVRRIKGLDKFKPSNRPDEEPRQKLEERKEESDPFSSFANEISFDELDLGFDDIPDELK